MSYRDELIALYARNHVANINDVAEFQALRHQLSDDPQFQIERHQIEIARQVIETAVKVDMPQQDQVRQAIQLLIQTRPDKKKRDLFHELIVAGYVPDWTDDRKRYFAAAWEKVQLEHDFFLSFTTRYPSGTAGENPVNNAYKHYIMSEIGPDDFKKADRRKTNLLASAVHRVLSQPPLKGFFFPHSQYDNTNTEQKLRAACDSCLVFVQLVQTIMFARPDVGTNYCFFEWERANSRFTGPDRDNHILFIVAAPDRKEILEALPYIDYNSWHSDVREKDPPYLPLAEFRDKTTLMQIRSAFKDKISPKIRGAWFRLINDAP